MSGIQQYAYTGDVKLLKTIGCKFQKLFADNYKAYHRDGSFMFVTTDMVLELDRIEAEHQATAVKFVLDNLDQPEEFWIDERGCTQWAITNHGNVHDFSTCCRLSFDAKKPLYDLIEQKASDEELQECADSIREKEGGRDAINFTMHVVNFIRDLNSLKPLEIIESKWKSEK